MNTIMKEITTS